MRIARTRGSCFASPAMESRRRSSLPGSASASAMDSDYRLSSPGRVLSLVALVFGGILPALVFAFWIERNCALPMISEDIRFPWIYLATDSLWLLAAWNIGLFLA